MVHKFITESEYKQAEYMIINNNICKTMKNINDVLQANLKNDDKVIESFKKIHRNNNYYKEKEDNKKEDKKKYNNNNNKYTYNLLLLLFNKLKIKNIFSKKIIRIVNKEKAKSIYKVYQNI